MSSLRNLSQFFFLQMVMLERITWSFHLKGLYMCVQTGILTAFLSQSNSVAELANTSSDICDLSNYLLFIWRTFVHGQYQPFADETMSNLFSATFYRTKMVFPNPITATAAPPQLHYFFIHDVKRISVS